MEHEYDDERLSRCLELFSQHQRRLYAFVNALVPSPSDAEEIVQEVNIVIWKKFDQFDQDDPKSDFSSWINRIATFQIKDYMRRSSKRDACLSPELIDQLVPKLDELQNSWEQKRTLLDDCLKLLEENDRKLVTESYAPDASIPNIAKKHQRKVTSIYRSLRRIRNNLQKCVELQIKAET